MSIRHTAYFREFLDFAYLWMRDNDKSVPATYRATPENHELWRELSEALPVAFFELCPMHLLGRLVDWPSLREESEKLVLTVSLNPGRNEVAEPLEELYGIYDGFGTDGEMFIEGCGNYFRTVGAKGGFWHKISRVTRQVLIGPGFKNQMTREWMDRSVAHVDLWPFRQGQFGPFIDHHANFPTGFQRPRRQQMLIELIRASDADLTILLGQKSDLGLPNAQVPALSVELLDPHQRIIPEFEIQRISGLPRCYRIPHPASRGCLVQWDNIAERIRKDLNLV